MIHKLARWIPEHISGKAIVAVYWLMNIFNYIPASVRKEHVRYNLKKLGNVLDSGHIDNQSSWKDIRFGAVDMAYAGCEVIATYNVLLETNKGCGPEYMAELISDFEKNGAVLGARIGTSPLAVKKQLDKRGIKTRLLWKTEQVSENARLFIATIINNKKDLYDQIHTVAISKQEKGYVVYNASRRVVGNTLENAIFQSSKDPVLVCILEITNEH